MNRFEDDAEPRFEPKKAKRRRKRDGESTWYERAFASLKRRLRGLAAGFRTHLFVFGVVNAICIGLNLTIAQAGGFPWAFFPLFGWGVGIAANLQAFLNRRREVAQLSRVPGIGEEAGRLFRKYQKAVGALAQHRTVFLAVNFLLFGTNLITSFVFPWFLFPLAAWSIGFFPHLMGNLAKRKALAEDLKEHGIDVKKLGDGAVLKETAPGSYASQAQAVKERLLKNLKTNQVVRERWGEIEPLLSTYVAQIGELENKRAELDRVMQNLSLGGIEHELKTVKAKRERVTDEMLLREYDKSIAQYEGHLKAATGLMHHYEILDLRLNGAYHLLNKLELDTVRLAHADSLAEPASLSALRGKTEEMQLFLEDFTKGIDELEQGL